MERIQILDNFFCCEHNQKIKDIIRSELWKANLIHHRNNIIVNNFREPNNKYKKFNNDWPFWRLELEENTFFKNVLKSVIEEKMNKELIVDRIYAVAQTYEQNSNFHTDYDSDNIFTLCYYINDNMTNDSGGYFHVKIPNEKMIVSVVPSDNRAVCFPSNYVHKGTGMNKMESSLRICIAWKLITINR